MEKFTKEKLKGSLTRIDSFLMRLELAGKDHRLLYGDILYINEFIENNYKGEIKNDSKNNLHKQFL